MHKEFLYFFPRTRVCHTYFFFFFWCKTHFFSSIFLFADFLCCSGFFPALRYMHVPILLCFICSTRVLTSLGVCTVAVWLSWLYFHFVHDDPDAMMRDEVFGENEHETKKNYHDKETGVEIPDPTYKHFGRVCKGTRRVQKITLTLRMYEWRKKCDEFFSFVLFIIYCVLVVRSLIFFTLFLFGMPCRWKKM